MPWKSDVIEAGQKKPVQSEGCIRSLWNPTIRYRRLQPCGMSAKRRLVVSLTERPESSAGGAMKLPASADTRTFAFRKVS